MAPDPDPPPDTAGLDARLKQARARLVEKSGPTGTGARADGLAIGMRIAIELAAAIVVGTGMGILLDRWLGTLPLMLLIFFLLGTAAGFLNVVRAAKDYENRRRREREAQARGDINGGPDGSAPPRT